MPFNASMVLKVFLRFKTSIISSLLYYSSFTILKLRPFPLLIGGSPPRQADLQFAAGSQKPPPRKTLILPFSGPFGFTLSLMLYSPYQSLHHSTMLPCISYKPNALGGKLPTGIGDLV